MKKLLITLSIFLFFASVKSLAGESKGIDNNKTGSPTTCPTLTVTPGAPQTICIGQTANLTVSASGGVAPYMYTWSPGGMTGSNVPVTPIVTTSYTVQTKDANGCPGTTVLETISVHPPLMIITSPAAAICPGGTVN